VLAGQRRRDAGDVLVKGSPYGSSRAEARTLNVRFIPEEPLRNACAPRMTVAENMAFRTFDLNEAGKPINWIRMGAIRD
ncbi:MAG: ABC transporter ATP-binding protein, partial [Mesorhizobium sp.]